MCSGFDVIQVESYRNLFMKPSYIVLLIVAVLVAGCAQDASDPQAPAQAVENYIEAQVNKDSEAFAGTFCAAYESEAMTEFDSFGAVEATIEDMTCEVDNLSDGTATVNCTGRIDVVYDGENNRTLDLARVPYSVVQEDGEWKMCGYAS